MSQKKTKQTKVEPSPASITLINSGETRPDAKFTCREVETLSAPRKTKEGKPVKPIAIKLQGNVMTFKHKVSIGKRKMKELKYENIVFLEQLLKHNRTVFIHYAERKKVYYFVFEFENKEQADRLVHLVKNSNAKVLTGPVGNDNDTETQDGEVTDNVLSATTMDTVSVPGDAFAQINSRTSPGEQYSPGASPKHVNGKKPTSMHPNQSYRYQSNGYTIINGTPVKATYVSTQDDEEDCSEQQTEDGNYPSNNSSESDYTLNNQIPAAQKKKAQFSSKKTYKWYANGGMNRLNEETDNDDYNHYRPSRNSRARASQDSLASYSDMEYDDNRDNYRDYKGSRTPRHSSRSHSRRPKSRQLPLSEGETQKSVMQGNSIYLTPDGRGGAKVTDYGPILLFSASLVKDNSDEESDSSASSSYYDSDSNYSEYNRSASIFNDR